MKLPLVTDIQRFCLHDGDGIRTTVFFKGCPLRCAWCHNPETQRTDAELLVFSERCTGCGACVAACLHGANTVPGGEPVFTRTVCVACGACVDGCVGDAREVSGRAYAPDALVKELEKDRVIYETSGGGVTLSGGEVLAGDMEYVEQILRSLHAKGYRVNIDTCGCVPYERFLRVLPLTDVFLYDIKMMDAEAHRRYTGADNALILDNLVRLSTDGATVDLRIPVISGVNDAEAQMQQIAAFIRDRQIRIRRVNLLPYHGTGAGKYDRLGRPRPAVFAAPSVQRMERLQRLWQENGFSDTRIGG